MGAVLRFISRAKRFVKLSLFYTVLLHRKKSVFCGEPLIVAANSQRKMEIVLP